MNPDRFYIDEGTRELYSKLESEPIFKNKSRKEQFLFTMGLGFKNSLKVPIKKTDGFFLAKDLKQDDEALIYSLALYDKKTIEILADKAAVYKIAEEYANGGIQMLTDKINSTQYGSFDRILEMELVGESFQKNQEL